MLTSLDGRGERCLAADTQREQGPFRCPECAKEMLLKKGTILVHHFAHRPPVNCAYGSGETMDHMRAKAAIHAVLKESPRVSKLALEEPIRKNAIVVRPDIRFALDGRVFVAVEFQRTSLDPREIERRTSNYFKLNVHVLWIAAWPAKLTPDQRFQPRETDSAIPCCACVRCIADGRGRAPQARRDKRRPCGAC